MGMNPTALQTKDAAIQSRARELLDALDRMYGRQSLSMNVIMASARLRELLPRVTDPRDESA